jgi:spore coat protein U-like protein
MKNFALILLALCSGTVFGQTSASATASAEIITALKIEKDQDLDLGTIAPLSNGTSTFILKSDGAIDGASTATDIDISDHTAASFTISGEGGEYFSLTIPTSVELAGTGNDMTLTLLHNLDATDNSLDSSGSATLTVGGSLALASNQAAGNYSGTINVSVAYQ